MDTVRIVIADDHQLFIEGIKIILSRADNFQFEIIGEAHSGKDLLELLKEVQPDLLLLDLNMPEGDGLNMLSIVKKKYKSMQVLALTMYDDVKLVRTAFNEGVDGYILKSTGKLELLEAIDEIIDGGRFFGDGVKIHVMSEDQRAALPSKFDDKFVKKYNLTKREIEILRLITLALSNKEIAKKLFISDQTVSVHRKNIMRKLQVSNTAALIKMAYDNSLV
jgi:DNA-binding NarL/FixJ family response regulator